MPLRADLLNPIAGPSPAGADLRYDSLYDKIKEARQEDDDAPQGDWQRPRKTADYALVVKLAGEALATRSKDLQLAAWLTEAQLRREGFAGFRGGLELLHAMIVQYWDTLYPPLEDGDPELRSAPLAWVGLALTSAVRSVPLNRAGHDHFKYVESRAVGYEAETSSDPKRSQARQQAIEEGRLKPEDFDAGFEATPKAWYKELSADIQGSVALLATLDELSRERFGDVAPDFRRLQDTLAEVQRVVGQLLARKLELEPDPVELRPASPPVSGTGQLGAVALGGEPEPSRAGSGSMSAEPVDRADTTARVTAAARFLQRTEPHNPSSYLLLRGFRWGELRAQGSRPDPRLLEAPSSQVRTQLKSLLLEARWAQLLEASEGVMATPAGRGWLDLQRYTLRACAGLGGEFDAVGRAIRGEVRALLTDLPTLTAMTLMDDLPAANPDTRKWLRDEGLSNGASPPDGVEEETFPMSGAAALDRATDEGLARAMIEVRAGRPQRAVELLMDELGREKTPRARFLRRTQIARIMVDAGLESIAMPMLQDLLTLIDTHKLAEWEAGDLVAEPMALLYRCIDKLPDDATAGEHSRGTLYPRICGLDPLQAIHLTQP